MSAHDPAAEIDRLVSRWDAISARLRAAGLITKHDTLTQEVWAHGGAIVVTSPDGTRHAYALNVEGRLHRWDASHWTPVEVAA